MIETATRSSLKVRLAAWAGILGAFVLACGVQVGPPGGPEDKTPPEVSEVIPARDSAGVAADSKIQLTFSENMARARMERLLSFQPEVVIASAKWKGNTLTITPEGGLHEDTTYIVTLKAGARDRHNVATKESVRFAFATSAHIDSGRIDGTIFFRRQPTARAVVRCFVLPKDTAFAPEAARPDREAVTNPEGEYSLKYLPTRNNSFIVWAYQDANGNGKFEPENEAGLVFQDTIRLSATLTAVASRDIAIIDPDEPGSVAGDVINETGIDTAFVSVGLFLLEGDSLPAAAYTVTDTMGAFEFKSVRAGTYIMRAFIDFLPDSLCGSYPCGPDSSQQCIEPCIAHPDTVRLEPGGRVKLDPLRLPKSPSETG